MTQAKFCPQCGAPIELGGQFCSKCGANVQTYTAPQEKSSVLKTTLLILGAILAIIIVLVALIIFVAFSATSSLVDTVEDQLEAIRGKDIAKAYSFTAKEFQDATPYEEFVAFVESVPALTNNVSASFPERKFENDQGTVRATLIDKDGVKTTVDYQLQKEKDAWRIINIHVLPVLEPAKDENN